MALRLIHRRGKQQFAVAHGSAVQGCPDAPSTSAAASSLLTFSLTEPSSPPRQSAFASLTSVLATIQRAGFASVALNSTPAGSGSLSEGQLLLQKALVQLPVLGQVARNCVAQQQASLGAQSSTPAGAAGQVAALPSAQDAGKELSTKKSGKKQDSKAKKPPKKLSPADQKLWDLFNDFDVNRDGVIDATELREALFRLGLPTTDTYLATTLQQFDNEAQQKSITWEEFKHYVERRTSQIDAAFREFDVDGDGEISTVELGAVLSRAGMPATGKDLRRLMDIMDKDHTNTISYNEFRRFAIFLPAWQVRSTGSDPRLYAGWMRSTSATATASQQRQQQLAALNDPLRHFFVFDILLRGSLGASLVVVTLMALNA